MKNCNQLKIHWLTFFVFLTAISFGQEKIRVHDPVMIRENGIYYLFCTGWGISVWSSSDMQSWEREEPVFNEPPQWATDAVEGFRGHVWAPDIAFYNNEYYLYYSVSSFGKNTSCIGLATNKTLDPSDPGFEWIDHGKVIQSFPGKTNWNAIDPNLIVDDEGTPYLSFGSFWGGLQLGQLTPDAKKINENTDNLITIASRKSNQEEGGNYSVEAGNNAIEAPFIFKKGDFYYLFASIDYCCRGPESTYKMIVGRSEKITGPYLDREGKPLNKGGGTLVLQGNKDWYGVGHNAVEEFDGIDYLIFHGYDASDRGRSKLLIREIKWSKDKWPEVKL
jgi:arabinan endo-1,5-alpha-L-arabinosidase